MRARSLVLALIALPLFLAAENPPSEYASLLAALKQATPISITAGSG
jgi:hypothetical protein